MNGPHRPAALAPSTLAIAALLAIGGLTLAASPRGCRLALNGCGFARGWISGMTLLFAT